ncbi:MAG TPA: 50S ribosomal protein L10 [Dehalococcoidales bacterium]|nr:50S ribosomal protein L10 [Dehalococcoidales bacterium]
MKKAQKAQAIDKLEKEFSEAKFGIFTDYRGLKTPEVNGLRRKLQDNKGDYKVVKNTLAVKAVEKLNKQNLAPKFNGPMAVVFGYGEEQVIAKTFSDHVRTSKINLGVKGGFLGNTLLSSEDVATLATLPPKPVLVAKVIGGIKSPLYALAGVLTAPMRNLQGTLQARIKQLEETKSNG